jgi:hypothetical protein
MDSVPTHIVRRSSVRYQARRLNSRLAVLASASGILPN